MNDILLVGTVPWDPEGPLRVQSIFEAYRAKKIVPTIVVSAHRHDPVELIRYDHMPVEERSDFLADFRRRMAERAGEPKLSIEAAQRYLTISAYEHREALKFAAKYGADVITVPTPNIQEDNTLSMVPGEHFIKILQKLSNSSINALFIAHQYDTPYSLVNGAAIELEECSINFAETVRNASKPTVGFLSVHQLYGHERVYSELKNRAARIKLRDATPSTLEKIV